MADVKISELASVGVPESTAVLPVVSSGTTKKVSIAGLAQALGVNNGVVTLVNTTSPLQGGPIFSSGTLSILPATTGNPGSMSAADKTKLDASTPNSNANTLVMRDASKNFSAGTITATSFSGPLTGNVTGNLTGNSAGTHTGAVVGNVTGNVTGNSSTATALQTARTISVSGDVTGTATSFDGSTNITIPAAITAGAIVNADINASANISHSKLAAIPSGQILIGNASTIPTATAISGDATLSSSGVLTIGNSAITTDKIADSDITTAKIADLNVTTAKIADSNVTDAKLSATGVTAASYGASATASSVVIPFFTVSSKGRITSAGSSSFPGSRVVNRVIYNDDITPSGVAKFDVNTSLITLPGTTIVGSERNVIGANYLDIFGGQLQAYTTQVSGSRVHFHFRFQATLYNGHAILSSRFKINNSVIGKIPVSVNGWPEFPVTWEYWYPVSTAGTVLNFVFEGRSYNSGGNQMRVHYARYWEGNEVHQGIPSYVYVSPQVVITEWV